MDTKISDELSTIIGYAREEAMRTGHYGIGTEHLMLGILRHRENGACLVLSSMGIDLNDMKKHLDSVVSRGWSIPYAEMDNIALTREAGSTLNLAILEAGKAGLQETGPIHLMIAICRSVGSAAGAYLAGHGINAGCLSTAAGTDRKASLPEPDDRSGEDVRTFIYPHCPTPSDFS